MRMAGSQYCGRQAQVKILNKTEVLEIRMQWLNRILKLNPEIYDAIVTHFYCVNINQRACNFVSMQRALRESRASCITSSSAGVLIFVILFCFTPLHEFNFHWFGSCKKNIWFISTGSADAVLSLVNAGSAVEAEDKDGLTGWFCQRFIPQNVNSGCSLIDFTIILCHFVLISAHNV